MSDAFDCRVNNLNLDGCGRLLAQATHDVIERQQRAPAPLHDRRFFGLAEFGAARILRPHGGIQGARAPAPLGHRLLVQPTSAGQGAG